MRRALTLALFLLAACGNPFAEAQKLHTIDAYEAFLKENPDSPYRLQAETALEELMLEEAREAKTLEAYDAWLTRFPEGRAREKVLEERRSFLFGWAEAQGTAEAWQKLLDEYPKAPKKERDDARKRLRMAENAHRVQLAPPGMEQVNLAEDPKGPLDGWAFTTTVTNAGDQPIHHLMLEVRYLGEDGKKLGSNLWPAVAKALPGNMPKPDGFDKPIPPGKTRDFEYTTGDLPASWGRKVEIVPVDIQVGTPTE